MGNFYDEWLGYWDAEQAERAQARKYIHEEDLDWVRTKQDYRTALLCARENGFITSGVTMLAEMPTSWHSGKHSHGEEAIFIVRGTGFSIVDDKRYDWEEGSCLFIPYSSVHQHFNSGENEVRYLSVMALPLERFAGLAKLMQYEEAGETPMGEPTDVEKAESDIHPEHGRIVLRLKDAPVHEAKERAAKMAARTDEFALSMAKEQRTAGAPGHRARSTQLMQPEMGFKAREMEITNILHDLPGGRSGKHSHMEALLYVLEGEGYSVMDGERFEWKTGTLFQVPGPNTVHQHWNTGQNESKQLRIHYGLRAQYFQSIARRVFPYQYYEYSSYGKG
ncbi:cupin domain-containing protein [Chloroflexota bacterium]